MRLEKTGQHPQERLFIARLQKDAEMRRFYVAHLPWWRHPLVGYLLTLPLVAMSLLAPFLLFLIGASNNFIGAPSFLVTVVVALIWGTGPAVFSILLGITALDYFFITPTHSLAFHTWRDALSLLPFLAAQIIVAILTSQRESARRNVLASQQE